MAKRWGFVAWACFMCIASAALAFFGADELLKDIGLFCSGFYLAVVASNLPQKASETDG